MRSVKEQLDIFRAMLAGKNLTRDSAYLELGMNWIRIAAEKMTPQEAQEAQELMCTAFGLTPAEYDRFRNGSYSDNGRENAARIEQQLMAMLPTGFLSRYARYTLHSEAPLAFHVFVALVAIGVMLGRKVWFDMGYYKLYPPLSVIILAPSGVKKTSAADIIVSMVREMQITKIYSEKLTPEALVEAMKDFAQGLIYAPELSVFLGNQDYNAGLVPLLTRFLDCPATWESGTIMRGRHILTEVAVSCLMCSTPDWFVSNTPKDIFEGGFIARNILVVQEASPRIEPIPDPGVPGLREALMAELAALNELKGELVMSPACHKLYVDWYTEQKKHRLTPEFELLTPYYQRKPDHVKRVAMCLHLADHKNMVLCDQCFATALALLDWVEQFLPPVLRKMFRTVSGAEQELVLRAVKHAGGVIKHADLIRKLQYRMHAVQVRNVIMSLKEAGQIEELSDGRAHIYVVKEEQSD